jgi:GrpB-like predicted nucleotidyltransferase (UPF0157 family)
MHSLSVAPSSSVDNTVDRTASAAHQVVDTLADQALTGVGKVSDLARCCKSCGGRREPYDGLGYSGAGTNAAEENQACQCRVRDHQSASVRHAGWCHRHRISLATWLADDPNQRRTAASVLRSVTQSTDGKKRGRYAVDRHRRLSGTLIFRGRRSPRLVRRSPVLGVHPGEFGAEQEYLRRII